MRPKGASSAHSPESRLNLQFVNRMNESAEVMANHFAQNLVDLSGRGLRSDRSAELSFEHRESSFDVRPLVVVRRELLPVKLVEVKHPAPNFATVVSDGSRP